MMTNEHKLSAMMYYRGRIKKLFGYKTLSGNLLARFLKYSTPRKDKLSGSERKRLRYGAALIRGETFQLPIVRLSSARVLRGNPARNPTALV